MFHDPFVCAAEDVAMMSRFLGQLERGEHHDHVAPLGVLREVFSDPTLDPDVLRQVMVAELWNACALDKAQGWLHEAELLQREKLGTSSRRYPYSVRRPDGGISLKEKFERYFLPRAVKLNARSASYADQQVARLWSKGRARLKLEPLDNAVCLFKQDTNFGFPRCTTDQDNLYFYYLESCRIVERGYPLADASDYPSIGTTRTQAAGFHQYAKDRALSMYCRAVSNLEKQIQVPLFRALRDLSPFSAWRGQIAVNAAVTALLDSRPGDVLSVDFTSFDASVPFDVLTRIYAIVASWFTGESEPLVRFVAEAFMRSGIYLPDGQYYHGTERTGGVPSGSGLTNLVGSLVNLWVFHYASHRDGGRVIHSQVNGDDGIFVFKDALIPRVSEILLDELGMLVKMDPAKNLVSGDQVRFLQMEHHRSHRVEGLLVGSRPVSRVLVKMTGMERRVPVKRLGLRVASPVRWRGIFNTFRWLQQMEACADHPHFEGFVLWYLDQDQQIGDVLNAIIRGDAVVYEACQMLSEGEEGELRLTPSSFRKSRVVGKLCELTGTPHV